MPPSMCRELIAEAGSERANQDVARCAYLIWEREGRPEGRALDHWIRAEACCAATRQRPLPSEEMRTAPGAMPEPPLPPRRYGLVLAGDPAGEVLVSRRASRV